MTEEASAFREEWYLEQYPEVAEAIRAGRFPSAYSHYILMGREEGRLPCPPVAQESPPEFISLSETHNGPLYRTPVDLQKTGTPIERVLVIGSCFLEYQFGILAHLMPSVKYDFVLINNIAELPAQPERAIESYNFQIVQIPLHGILTDTNIWNCAYPDLSAHEVFFEDARSRLARYLDAGMGWNRRFGILTFVSNFFVPQQNSLGRLMPRYDLRNPVFFVEQLNRELGSLLQAYQNAYLLDQDEISATFGRKYFQDDINAHTNHGSFRTVYPDGGDPADAKRIIKVPPLEEHYEQKLKEFVLSSWAELVAMYRTIRRLDEVKLVVVDLDDTLWRNVAVDDPEIAEQSVLGWPLGVVEALLNLKKRGILLGIISKNEEQLVAERWQGIMTGVIQLADFNFRKINWHAKSENMKEILEEARVLPQHVLYIDDNPRERAEIAAVFPEIRMLGDYPYYLRRILLWAPETQVPWITAESAERANMFQAQQRREALRQDLSREEFLQSLQLELRVERLTHSSSPGFQRSLELLNKTNQFNTTGKRWTVEECLRFFGQGGCFYTCEVSDRFTRYGVVVVVCVHGASIEQFVMSCRVIGLDIERAVLSEVVRAMRRTQSEMVRAKLEHTQYNFVCRDFFEKSGFRRDPDMWVLPAGETPTSPNFFTSQALF